MYSFRALKLRFIFRLACFYPYNYFFKFFFRSCWWPHSLILLSCWCCMKTGSISSRAPIHQIKYLKHSNMEKITNNFKFCIATLASVHNCIPRFMFARRQQSWSFSANDLWLQTATHRHVVQCIVSIQLDRGLV